MLEVNNIYFIWFSFKSSNTRCLRSRNQREGDKYIGKVLSVYWPLPHDDHLKGLVTRRIDDDEGIRGTHMIFYPFLRDTVPEILENSDIGEMYSFFSQKEFKVNHNHNT